MSLTGHLAVLRILAVGTEPAATSEAPGGNEFDSRIFRFEELVEKVFGDAPGQEARTDLSRRSPLTPQPVEGLRREAAVVDIAVVDEFGHDPGNLAEDLLRRLPGPLAAFAYLPFEQRLDTR